MGVYPHGFLGMNQNRCAKQKCQEKIAISFQLSLSFLITVKYKFSKNVSCHVLPCRSSYRGLDMTEIG
jgi:hypothetical protein